MVPIRDLARALMPAADERKVLALLNGYFDESGIHAGARATVVAGFVGTEEEWTRVDTAWLATLKDHEAPYFHYREMRAQKKAFADWETAEWQALAKSCASVLAKADLRVVAAAFMGDWDRVTAVDSFWKERFPTAYHFVLEMTAVQLLNYSRDLWSNEQIALVFDRQNDFDVRALEVVRVHQDNGLWSHIGAMGYADKIKTRPLQCADMIANETYRCVGNHDLAVWRREALLSRLLERDDELLGGVHTEESAIRLLKTSESPRRIYLVRNPTDEQRRTVLDEFGWRSPHQSGASLGVLDPNPDHVPPAHYSLIEPLAGPAMGALKSEPLPDSLRFIPASGFHGNDLELIRISFWYDSEADDE